MSVRDQLLPTPMSGKSGDFAGAKSAKSGDFAGTSVEFDRPRGTLNFIDAAESARA